MTDVTTAQKRGGMAETGVFAGYLFALFFPILGLIIGLALVVGNEIRHGVRIIALSVLVAVVIGVALFLLSGMSTAP